MSPCSRPPATARRPARLGRRGAAAGGVDALLGGTGSMRRRIKPPLAGRAQRSAQGSPPARRIGGRCRRRQGIRAARSRGPPSRKSMQRGHSLRPRGQGRGHRPFSSAGPESFACLGFDAWRGEFRPSERTAGATILSVPVVSSGPILAKQGGESTPSCQLYGAFFKVKFFCRRAALVDRLGADAPGGPPLAALIIRR